MIEARRNSNQSKEEELIEHEAHIARARLNLTENHGVRFMESSKYEFPDLDFKLLEKEGIDPEFAADMVRLAKEYLSQPLVIDTIDPSTIAGHKERQRWKEELFKDPELGQAYRELLEQNRLRVNRLGGFSMAINLMIEEVKHTAPKSDLIPALREIYDGIPNPSNDKIYKAASLEDKQKFVEQACRSLVKFIMLFATAKKVQYAQAS